MSMQWAEVWQLPPNQWPFEPPGYLFLPKAANRICAATWPEAWEGTEFQHLRMHSVIPSPEIAFRDGVLGEDMARNHGRAVLAYAKESPGGPNGMPSAEQWARVHAMFVKDSEFGHAIDERRMAGIEEIQRLAAADKIIISARDDIGNMHDLPAKIWNVDRELSHKRFSRCRINLGDPYRMPPRSGTGLGSGERDIWERAMKEWLFVKEESVESLEQSNLKGSETPQSAPSPAIARRGRRPGVGGFKTQDLAIVEEMVEVVRAKGVAPWAAATEFLSRIAGHTNEDDAKLKRVVGRYYERFDELGNPKN